MTGCGMGLWARNHGNRLIREIKVRDGMHLEKLMRVVEQL